MAETDMPELRDINQARDVFTQNRKHTAQSSVEEERLVVSYKEMTEFEVDLGDEHRDTEDVLCDFSDGGQVAAFSLQL